jgi:hypothetical protein
MCLVDFDYKDNKNLLKSKHPTETHFQNKDQNSAKESVKQLREKEIDHPILELEEKVLVKQSYEKKLTKFEKNELEKVEKEENEYENKLLMLKRKKEIEREERLERIKKMKTTVSNGEKLK